MVWIFIIPTVLTGTATAALVTVTRNAIGATDIGRVKFVETAVELVYAPTVAQVRLTIKFAICAMAGKRAVIAPTERSMA